MKNIGEFDPKTNKFPYPIDTDKHYIILKKDRGIKFDANYPYVDKSKGFRFKRFWIRLIITLIVFPMTKIRLGLKVCGKKNLKKNKKLIKEGVITVSNHIHMWDYLAIMRTVRHYNWPYVLVWNKNVNDKQGKNVRMVGGIPIPDDLSGTKKYLSDVKELLNSGNILHLYAEGSMWEYYKPIRPFKLGAFKLADQFDKPVIPIGFSYRRPGFIRRKIFKQIACLTINVGEPLFINKDLNKHDRITDLANRCHDEVCKLSGIKQEDNLYEKIYNNSKRIDYYTDSYGEGYKGSK